MEFKEAMDLLRRYRSLRMFDDEHGRFAIIGPLSYEGAFVTPLTALMLNLASCEVSNILEGWGFRVYLGGTSPCMVFLN